MERRQAPGSRSFTASLAKSAFAVSNVDRSRFGLRDGCVARLEVPGLAAEGLAIESQGQRLTITGKRGPEVAPGAVHRNERWRGEFSRFLELPRELDPSQAEVDYRNGVLTIGVPLHEDAKARQIEVRAA